MTLVLLPPPKECHITADTFQPTTLTIHVDADHASLQPALDACVLAFHAAGCPARFADDANLRLVHDASITHEQGYRLTIDANGITLAAATTQGLFYAIQTLIQIVRQTGTHLPQLVINDQPDFAVRGFMLDISRNKVPTLATILMMIGELAHWKYNQIQLYIEHTFAYPQHPSVWAEASPLSAADVAILEAYCHEHFIDLVPNQNTFGHMQRWLTKPAYHHLAECPDGFDTGDLGWGVFTEPFSLSPAEPGSIELVRDMLDTLIPQFSSQYVNIGCDEVIELGQGKSADLVAERGKSTVYLDFVRQIQAIVAKHGKITQCWADMLLHDPTVLRDMPANTIALTWGYEADHPFDYECATLAAANIPFYACPGTSSWNTIAGRTDNALANIRSATTNGLKHAAQGILMTDWGDNGHWQPWSVSYLGLVEAAARSWHNAAEFDLVAALNRLVFRDHANVLGGVMFDLGNIYQDTGVLRHNSSVLFTILQSTPAAIRELAGVTIEALQTCRQKIAQISQQIHTVDLQRDDAQLILAEVRWIAACLDHATWRGEWALHDEPADMLPTLQTQITPLIAEFERLWLARNRWGGLALSLELWQTAAQSYVKEQPNA